MEIAVEMEIAAELFATLLIAYPPRPSVNLAHRRRRATTARTTDTAVHKLCRIDRENQC